MRKLFVLVLFFKLILISNLLAQYDVEGNGKDYGIAINPVGALFSWYSLEYNIWKADRTGEINIPFQLLHNPFDTENDDHDLTIFSIGAQYRKFFSSEQQGFFVQAGFIHYNFSVDGKGEYRGESAGGSVNSVLFGFGYRMISKTNGLFWSAALSAGKGWGSVDSPNGEDVSNSGFTYDIDLLKIGYAW
ncbi:MAG: hypothetical protein D8M58_20375 [Calditrichaeota bacterium]|nr:MAG: hypothetical protein DWQ03_14360 [Calditrichota bacterium]MBL1207767.1 hypothetical protein [Calditrichota bacterium]NOG47600.1 DUF3575 domain-containing protein [Calditrichota bacterium]